MSYEYLFEKLFSQCCDDNVLGAVLTLQQIREHTDTDISHLYHPNSSDNMGTTAVYRRKIGMVKSTFAILGVDWNVYDNLGLLPLVEVIKNHDLNGLRCLLSVDDIDVNKKDKYGMCAILAASQIGWSYMLQILIEKGADIKATNDHGETILHLAIKMNKLNILEDLLAFGADPYGKNDEGHTAFEYARIHISDRMDMSRTLLILSGQYPSSPYDM